MNMIGITAACVALTIPVSSLPSASYTTQTKLLVNGVYYEETNTPTFASYSNKYLNSNNIALINTAEKHTLISDAYDLFPGLRDFTEEESDAYEDVLDKIFVSTGENFFDYVKRIN
ncbi:hypothetical protein [Paenibacillus kandeliae]|uniref:hypothetical protein n=1 Tax=Paenibacillus kandeliae TaxID=3231269 RepID=UPI00345AC285